MRNTQDSELPKVFTLLWHQSCLACHGMADDNHMMSPWSMMTHTKGVSVLALRSSLDVESFRQISTSCTTSCTSLPLSSAPPSLELTGSHLYVSSVKEELRRSWDCCWCLIAAVVSVLTKSKVRVLTGLPGRKQLWLQTAVLAGWTESSLTTNISTTGQNSSDHVTPTAAVENKGNKEKYPIYFYWKTKCTFIVTNILHISNQWKNT